MSMICLYAACWFSTLSANNTDPNTISDPKWNSLTPEEEKIIVHKGTEAPFTGEYYKTKEKGTYQCRRCNASLYRSADKFDSGCGWPSFDDEIPGSVKHVPDSDGIRTEILCARCGGHLGHVFSGEKLTPKNTRHCVNSASLRFVPDTSDPVKTPIQPETAYFAGGCFWGVEYLFKNMPGILSTRVGYMGGTTRNPTYKDVCTGLTGHAETLEIVFDPAQTTYETLARRFFEIHDPTQENRQGPDVGTQYRSAVFCKTSEQRAIIQKLIRMLEQKGFLVATKCMEADTFWPAEDYHQAYYQKKNKKPYCHAYIKRF